MIFAPQELYVGFRVTLRSYGAPVHNVTDGYKHLARAPRKLDISDWVKVPVEKV